MTRPAFSTEREPWFLKFHDLMPFRVREVLLVSPAYDAFVLEEDGRLTEQLLTQYSELNLTQAPRIIHVATGERALDLLRERRFDMVLTVVRLADMNATEFTQKVRERFPTLPVLLLIFDEADIRECSNGVWPPAADAVLQWTGDSRALIAGIKLIEDIRNVDHDTRTAGVQVIIVVEDAVHRYSTFLTLLYRELVLHANSLIAEGVNPMHKVMRMRARPKLLLATTFEEAWDTYQRYREFVTALITDVRFPRGGREDPQAGFDLVRRVRDEDSGLPILMQSAEPHNARGAAALGCAYADKNSQDLLARTRAFLRERLGFGDFVFRLGDGTVVARARNVYDMERCLRQVPAESVEHHGLHNHFSLWLKARCLFPQAQQIRPRSLREFPSVEAAREFLLDVLATVRQHEHEGMITDFSAAEKLSEGPLMRLSGGSVGGKGRGIAFVASQVRRRGLADQFEGLEVRVPRTIVIGTDAFDAFMARRRERDDVLLNGSSAELISDFLSNEVPWELEQDLRSSFEHMHGPVAVRSSSLLEDSRYQAFAGIYDTWLLPNSHPDPEVRFRELCNAVRAVYASTYSPEARAYFRATSHSIEEEKMGVVVQEVVGQAYGKRFYPHVSGVAQSYNFYPVAPQKAEQGIALLALGLGHGVVSGGRCVRFSPSAPTVLPHLASARDLVRLSQRTFYALDLARDEIEFRKGCESNLVQLDIAEAEADGTFSLVGSVYSPHDDVLRDSLSYAGPRVVTMNNLLKWHAVPLAEALAETLAIFRRAMGGEVEIEFALDLGDYGRPGRGPGRPPRLFLLQVRPMIQRTTSEEAERLEPVPPEQVLCRTTRALGHGVIRGIRDIVYVQPGGLNGFTTPRVAEAVGEINTRLRQAARPYLLIGPGRWGTSDPALGIPVSWSQISSARVIVETPFSDRAVEPSQGTHFFMNITSLQIGYLSVLGGIDDPERADSFLDLAWLRRQEVVHEAGAVRWVRLQQPVVTQLFGHEGVGRILKR